MKILLLSSQGLRCDIVYGYLNKNHNVIGVVIDNTYSKSNARAKKVKRRIKKYGIFKVFLQIAFTRIVVPFLKISSKSRILELLSKTILEQPHNHKNVVKTTNINSKSTIEFVNSNKPDIIVVHATTIIKKKMLSQINCPIINFHIGITPRYRGLFGGYWAAYNGDLENFGTTVHFLDEGIDTGKIISQKRIPITKQDNYYTYQFLQTIEGLDCLKNAIDALESNVKTQSSINDNVSRFYTQPTISQYFYKRLFFGVK